MNIAQFSMDAALFEPFLRYGLLGAVVAWILMRLDTRLGSIEHKVTGLNRTLLIELLSRDDLSLHAKTAAREELEKLNRPK